jgi:hypothetical protein
MPKARMTARTPEGRPARGGGAHRSGVVSRVARWSIAALLGAAAPGCSRQIEEEPPIPEHRFGTCETWCALMFDPMCPAQPVEVETEEKCFEGCLVEEGVWAPVDGHDDCAATHIPYVDCLASLPCSELQQHFAWRHVVPTQERSSCGGLLRAQLDCQTAHY